MSGGASPRIVSLLPSATEIICDLGLGPNLVGISHECDYPVGVQNLEAVTSSVIPKDAPSSEIDRLVREHLSTNSALYQLDLDLLRRLLPDLIVTQALCDVCAVSAEDVEAAVSSLPGRPAVINLEPMCLEDLFTTMLEVGRAAGIERRAATRVAELKGRITAVEERSAAILGERPRVAFLEWIDPPFNAGHWTPELLELAGGLDVLGNAGRPSITLNWDDVAASAPDVLCIACCGFSAERALEDLPILQRRPGWESLPCVRHNRIYVFDGNAFFNRPGPRLVDSLELLAYALHPQVHTVPDLPPGSLLLIE